MDSDKRLYIVLGLVALGIAAIMVYNFEYRKVIDVSWDQTYDYKSKDPYGTWLFYEVLSSSFPEAEIRHGSPADFDTTREANSLYLRIANRASLSKISMDTIYRFINHGNQGIILGNVFDGPIDSLYGDEYYCYNRYPSKTLDFSINDSLGLFMDGYTYVDYNQELDTSKYGLQLSVFENDYYYDSTYVADFVQIDSSSQSLMIRFPFGDNGGEFFLGTAPTLYSNISLQQKDMIRYLDQLMTQIKKPEIIYWDDRPGAYFQFGNESESPLKYILSQRGLRVAYFMLTGLAFLFILFRSKRRQKIIPIKEKVENTSLEYIDTLSKLYHNEERHEKLVGHMEKIFYHNVEKDFFLTKDHPDFINVLAKKSRQKPEEIERLIDRFKEAKNANSISSYQLQKISERIEEVFSE